MVLEALKESETLNELASKWKNDFIEKASAVFSGLKEEHKELEKLKTEKDELFWLLGESKTENEFLKKQQEAPSDMRKSILPPPPDGDRCADKPKASTGYPIKTLLDLVDELYTEDPTRGRRRMLDQRRRITKIQLWYPDFLFEKGDRFNGIDTGGLFYMRKSGSNA